MSFDKLIKKIEETKNPTVAGLDPDISQIPAFIRDEEINKHGYTFAAAESMLIRFNTALIDALCDIVPAVKPQAAYYEMYGWHGIRALKYTVDYARSKGMYVIVDGKRNDIGSSMTAYAKAYLGESDIGGKMLSAFSADALTVNAYLGGDVEAALHDICVKSDKGIFILCKTSNPSSGDLQDADLGGRTVYETMGDFCEKWGSDTVSEYGYSHVGAVVGATYPRQLAELRERLPHTFFLVPGYGAQGGGAADVAGAFDKNGYGAIINSSRGIMYAYKKQGCPEQDFTEAARHEAIRMRDEITEYIGKKQ